MNKDNLSRLRFNLFSLILFVLIFLVTIGAGFQALFELLDKQSYPPPGEMINLDGYSLHLNCIGTGNITILLESDLTFPGSQWVQVQNRLAQETQVCSYDRAGLGWSDPSPLPRKGQDMVEETYRLLRKANIGNPLIVVGYRGSTLLSRLFAHRYPEIVQGVVLIDPLHEKIKLDSALIQNNWSWRQAQEKPVSEIITFLGITRLRGYLGGLHDYREPLTTLPQRNEDELLALTVYRTKHWPAAAEDIRSLADLQVEVMNNRDIESVPFKILVTQSGLDSQAIDNGGGDQQGQALIEDLLSISSQSSLDVCTDCGIMPPITDPDVVISTIRAVIEKVNP